MSKNWIWHTITHNGRYAIKPNQTFINNYQYIYIYIYIYIYNSNMKKYGGVFRYVHKTSV